MSCRRRLGATAAARHPVDLENVPDDSVTTSSSRAMRAKLRVASFVAARVESRPNARRVKRNLRGDRATATASKAARGDANRFPSE
jgi:predicted 2-oxoglutarate/Fe(II)-dependent dioxygenase YbiX